MKGVLTIAGVTLLLVACNQSDPCRPHKDEALCLTDKACKWKAEKKKCKTAKKEKILRSRRRQHQLRQSKPPPQWSQHGAPRPASTRRCHLRRPSRNRLIQKASVDLGIGEAVIGPLADVL